LNTSPFIILINNVALLLAFGLLNDLVAYRPRGEKPTIQQIITGLTIGLIGIAVMLTPWEFSSGVVFDTRSILIGISGLFFGTIPTIIAVLVTSAFRLYNGGAGAWAGVAVIFTSGAIGLVWRHFRKSDLSNISVKELYVMGVVVHINMLLWLFALPKPLPLLVLSEIALPVILIFPISTALLGWLIVDRGGRRRAEAALRENEKILQTIVEKIPDTDLFIVEKDYRAGFVLGQEISQLHLDPEKFVGLSMEQVFGENAVLVEGHYEKSFAGEESSFDLYIFDEYESFRTVPLSDDDGSISRILVVVENITERKESEINRLRAQESLRQASTAITSALDMETVMNLVAEEIGRGIDSTSAYVNNYDSVNNVSVVVAEYIGDNANASERISDLGKVYSEDDDTEALNLLRSNQHIISHIDDSNLTPYEQTEMKENKVKTILYIPLLNKDDLLGYLECWDTSKFRDFSQHDINFCKGLAEQAAIALKNARSFEGIKSVADRMKMLFDTSQALSSDLLEVEDIGNIIAHLYVAIMPIFNSAHYYPECEISLYDPEKNTLKMIGGVFLEDDMETMVESEIGEEFSCDGYPVTMRAIENLEPYIVHVSDPDADPAEVAYLKEYEFSSVFSLPMAVKGKCIGLIELGSYDFELNLTTEEINLAKTIANMAAFAIENALVFDQLQSQLANIKKLEGSLREQAVRDPLTGQFNRRYMDEALQRELGRASRKGEPLSIVMIDLDHLKKINDEFGHVMGGDEALKLFTNNLKTMCREEDTLCRYAGDEFLIILYDTTLDVAKERAIQWRNSLKKLPSNQKFGVTFSAGVATFPDHGSTGEEILIQADRALYNAKKQGRDRIIAAEKKIN